MRTIRKKRAAFWKPPENNPGGGSVQAPGLGAKGEIRSSKSVPRPGVSGLAQTARSLWRVSTSRQSSVCLFIFLDRETKGNYKWERRWVRMGPDGRKRCRAQAW